MVDSQWFVQLLGRLGAGGSHRADDLVEVQSWQPVHPGAVVRGEDGRRGAVAVFALLPLAINPRSPRANGPGIHRDPHRLGLGEQPSVGGIQAGSAVVLAAILSAWPGHHDVRLPNCW